MDELLARYLDGDLSERDARQVLRAAETDPRFADELRDMETLLADAQRMEPPALPPGFVDRVMTEVQPTGLAGRGRWTRALALAAALMIGLLAGALGARLAGGRPLPDAPAVTGGAVHSVVDAPSAPGVEYFRAVRFVYSPGRASVRQVGVAGSFNGWNHEATPMVRDGDVWTLLLLLPPGTHEYMFVEDGTRWVTDPAAPETREDGFGGVNGVLPVRS